MTQALIATLKTTAASGDGNWSKLNGWASSIARAITDLVAAQKPLLVTDPRTGDVFPRLQATNVVVLTKVTSAVTLPDPRRSPGARITVTRLDTSAATEVYSPLDGAAEIATIAIGVAGADYVSNGIIWVGV